MKWEEALAMPSVYLAVCILYYIVPGTISPGYVTHPVTGNKLIYRLNGLRVFVIVLLFWIWCVLNELVALDVFYRARWASFFSTNFIGISLSFLMYFRGVVTQNKTSSAESFFWRDFFLGLEENPHVQVWDFKMVLYLLGGTGCAFNTISFAAHQAAQTGVWEVATVLHVAMILWFVAEYLFHEKVHLYTYDFVAEKVGFKLIWGCLCFYTMFYPIGAWSIASSLSIRHPSCLLFAAFVSFLTGWVLSRGANNQKFLFKTNPKATFLGVIPPEAIGEQLLCSGFWGLSRHINYLGDALMATGIALTADFRTILPWMYPLYYVLLFVGRQIDDDARCRRKYKDLWDEYCKRVPYRIVPYVYS